MRRKPCLVWLVLTVTSVLGGCELTDLPLKLEYSGYTPATLDDGWEVSAPVEEGLDPDQLNEIYREIFSEGRHPTVHSLLVVKNGKLVAEAYVRDAAARDRLHHLQSATKTVTSLLLGIAVDEGLVDSLGVRVYDIVPQHFDDDPGKREITLYHAVTMSSGLAFDNDLHTAEMVWSSGSSLAYVLGMDMSFPPGGRFDYNDGNPQLISGVIQEVAGVTQERFARERLFGPLGITGYRWDHHSDGTTFGAFGLWMKPRDMARIGLMAARGGAWQGTQIVSTAWLAEGTRAHNREGTYGYYWWVKDSGAFLAQGHGGQIIQVAPDLDLVVVISADPYSDLDVLGTGLSALADRVMDSAMSGGG
jgi:CubicO group peptidase (beta-lactamase class C family)